jgi:hypothetical protein
MDREPEIASVRITQRADFSTNRKQNSDPQVKPRDQNWICMVLSNLTDFVGAEFHCNQN